MFLSLLLLKLHRIRIVNDPVDLAHLIHAHGVQTAQRFLIDITGRRQHVR